MNEPKNKFEVRLIFNTLAILLFIFVLLGVLSPILWPHRNEPPKAKCRLELESVGIALKGYQAQYSDYPKGDQNEIIKSLLGNNLQKIQFLNAKLNSSGEFLDPWGIPYAIKSSSTNGFIISSAGKDKVFGDADDIIFNSISNDFVKP